MQLERSEFFQIKKRYIYCDKVCNSTFNQQVHSSLYKVIEKYPTPGKYGTARKK
jgi:hypothetical protein